MIFRAIFWIGLVALLMPHEPDLGFGRPAAIDTGVTAEVTDWARSKLAPNIKNPENLCRYNAGACAVGASVLDQVRASAIRSLSSVKADIHANGRARLSGTGG